MRFSKTLRFVVISISARWTNLTSAAILSVLQRRQKRPDCTASFMWRRRVTALYQCPVRLYSIIPVNTTECFGETEFWAPSRSGRHGEVKIIDPSGTEPRFLGRPARSTVAAPQAHSQSPYRLSYRGSSQPAASRYTDCATADPSARSWSPHRLTYRSSTKT
jgi:hypothetical protein